MSVYAYRDVFVGVQRVLLRYNEDQSSHCRLSSQHRLSTASTGHVLTHRRLGLEHHVGHGLRPARLSVTVLIRYYYCCRGYGFGLFVSQNVSV